MCYAVHYLKATHLMTFSLILFLNLALKEKKISGNESINRCFIDSKMCNYICDDPKYEYTSESFDMMKVEKE